jgi:hypothetical protein
LYLEIDQAFVDNHGSFQAALDYIDLLVSAASVIYEKEIDTHLHVVHVQKTNRYNSATSTTDALSIMRSAFAGSDWHYNNVDLHHALLAKDLGGGIAYVGALCNSNYGFGLSANLAGNFDGLGASTVWDLTVVAHELGVSDDCLCFVNRFDCFSTLPTQSVFASCLSCPLAAQFWFTSHPQLGLLAPRRYLWQSVSFYRPRRLCNHYELLPSVRRDGEGVLYFRGQPR